VNAAVVDDPEDAVGVGVRFLAHHLGYESVERFDVGGRDNMTEEAGLVDIPRGLAYRSDRRGDEPITGLRPRGRASDWLPTRDFPSWPGHRFCPLQGRRYDCSRPLLFEVALALPRGSPDTLVRPHFWSRPASSSTLSRRTKGPLPS
jgi:hypothetical protein